jgi:hypothetical protein
MDFMPAPECYPIVGCIALIGEFNSARRDEQHDTQNLQDKAQKAHRRFPINDKVTEFYDPVRDLP